MTSSSDSNSLTEASLIESPWFALLSSALKKSLLNIPFSNNYFVAFSGGMDSSLLLELASRYLSEYRQANVVAIHVHHGLSDHADLWQSHCENVCHRLGVELVVRQVSLNAKKKGVEEAARAARYGVFEQVLPSESVLLQGHHLNDQAETVLLRLMRGAGVKGIAGIPKTRALHSAQIHRPFLEVPRSELLRASEALELEWVEDDSNASSDYDRNFIRHEVIPKLESRWQGAVSRLAVSADHCSESAELEASLANIDLEGITQDLYGSSISITGLIQLPLSRQRNAVRYWLKYQGLGFPGEKRFQRIWSELLVARDDASPLIEWSLGAVRRYRNAIFSLSTSDINTQSDFRPNDISICYDAQLADTDDELGVLFQQQIMGRFYSLRIIESLIHHVACDSIESAACLNKLLIRPPTGDEQITVKFRQGGEVFKPVGKAHHRPLKKWFHDSNVPPWLRDSVPLLYYNECLVAIGNLLVSDGFQGERGSANLEISWGQKLNHNQL